MSAEYIGELRCRATHGPSGSVIETDAPADNHGKAERFSPTDLVGAALVTCVVTTIGIVAQRKGWAVDGMKMEVTKEMSATPPRRIVRLAAELWMPHDLPPADRKQVEEMARSCPVHKCLHTEVEAPVTVHWPSPP
jgi:uncharacterized OsmC-like protein